MLISTWIIIISIRNVKNPHSDGDAASKNNVDTRINLTASNRDLESYLPLDGSEKMTGNLDMNNRQTKYTKEPTEKKHTW